MSPEDVGLKASPLASKEPCQRVREAEPLAPEAVGKDKDGQQ